MIQDTHNLTIKQQALYEKLLVQLAPEVYRQQWSQAPRVEGQVVKFDYEDLGEELCTIAYNMARKADHL